MTLTDDDVIRVLKLVEESDFGELRLETGDLKLFVRKKGFGTVCAEPETISAVSKPANEKSERPLVREAPPAGTTGAPGKASVPVEGTVAIKSPMLGTVYLRPSPDAPHYVEVGSYVKEQDTVCLIEVMKVFTAVKAGVSGYVDEILVESNAMVEYGQPLFFVSPRTEPDGE